MKERLTARVTVAPPSVAQDFSPAIAVKPGRRLAIRRPAIAVKPGLRPAIRRPAIAVKPGRRPAIWRSVIAVAQGFSPVLLALIALVAHTFPPVLAQAPDAERIRAAFLKMIDRPRVALDPESRPRADSGIYHAEHFTFASEAGERVPGIFLKSVRANDRRPAIILLHGTGARKEELLATMRTLADRGFVCAAIDSRHHGERIRAGSGNDQYFAAMLETYRTGKGGPYLYDTVWDVMRLVDYLGTREDVDPRRIGIMGISKGGTEAYLAAGADPRIVVAVPIIGVQSYRWGLDNNQWQTRVSMFSPPVESAARDEGVQHLDAAFVRRFYDRVVPGIYGDYDAPSMLTLVAPRPLLVINGDSDRRTPLPGVQEAIDAAQVAYKRLGASEKFGVYFQPDAGHFFTPVAELVMADWFVKWLAPK
jgi:dienelactone hydrolase